MYFKNVALCCAGILSINISNAHNTINNGPFQHPVKISTDQYVGVHCRYLCKNDDEGPIYDKNIYDDKDYKHYYKTYRIVYDCSAYKNFIVPENFNNFGKYISFNYYSSDDEKEQFLSNLNSLYIERKRTGNTDDFITKFNAIIRNIFGSDWIVYYNIAEDFSDMNKEELIIRANDENGNKKEYIPVFYDIPFDELILGKCEGAEILKGKNELVTTIEYCKNNTIRNFVYKWYNYITPWQFDMVLSNGKNTIHFDTLSYNVKIYEAPYNKKNRSKAIGNCENITIKKTFSKLCYEANKAWKDEQRLVRETLGNKCTIKYKYHFL